uniref:Isocitrate dehydrogenase [NADP] n=1 Tax=Phaseolus vulgaris TaxID=3885 RepID=T2DMJ9_PHAVU|nr:NADPH-specific isocitrate dehydrogenase [Phaseolus vulgaris]
MAFQKINVANPIVEMDGDEMTRVIWKSIKDKLILPFLELDIKYYDLGLPYRDETDDKVTTDSAEATLKYNVAIKCATITPDEARVKEFGLKQMWKSPNGTIRNILNGTVFREPILCKNIPRLVPGWTKAICIGRHAFGDQYRATDSVIKGAGKLTLVFVPEGGGEKTELKVFNFKGERSVSLTMYNTDESIRSFAEASMTTAFEKKWALYLSTKNTILKKLDGRFKDIFQEVFGAKWKLKFGVVGIGYKLGSLEIRGVNPFRGEGGYEGPAKNYEGNVQSIFLVQGFGTLGLEAFFLVFPGGKAFEAETTPGTVSRPFWVSSKGGGTHPKSQASLFSRAKGFTPRAKMGGKGKLLGFPEKVGASFLGVIGGGKKAQGLAFFFQGSKLSKKPFLNPGEFIGSGATGVSEKIFA